VVNAGTAVAAALLLRARLTGIALDEWAIEEGLTAARWPARMQRLDWGPLPSLLKPGSELWLDGGHNPDGARALAAAMADLEERNAAPLVLVVGMLGTKDADAFLHHFLGLAREVIAVPIPSQVAARPAEEIAAIAHRVGLTATTAPNVEAALAALHEYVWDRPPRVLVCGSLYLAGEVLSANGTPPG
jgi:dihydrofolate synthase/folylpolyglutamate synthase